MLKLVILIFTLCAGMLLNASELQGGILDLADSNKALVVNEYKGVLGKQPRTISAKIKFTEMVKQQFVSYGGKGLGGDIVDIGIWRKENGEMVVRAEFGMGFLLGKSALSVDQWHFISVVTNNQGFVKIYVDGKLDAKLKLSIMTLDFFDVKIGCSRDGRRRWNGQIDSISIWDAALPAAQIKKLMNHHENLIDLIHSEKSLKLEKLQLYYSFDGNEPLIDKSKFQRIGDLAPLPQNAAMKKNGLKTTKVKHKSITSEVESKTIFSGQITVDGNNLSWEMANEEGIKEFRVLNSKTGVVFQVIEAVGADLYSINLPSGIVPQIVAVDAESKVYKLKSSNKTK